ncbi:TPA: polyketide cyclase / dehydrase and lipid transport, partial [Neisseria meningitidis]
MSAMNSIQVADQTFIAADPADIGRAISSPADWRRWWPDLQLNVVEERGEKGIRWTVAGPLTGTMEVWLEPALDGAIAHYF